MTKRRTRDKIWELTLNRTVLENEPITISEAVAITDASERTVREVLSVMSKTPFLDRAIAPDGSVRFFSSLELPSEDSKGST